MDRTIFIIAAAFASSAAFAQQPPAPQPVPQHEVCRHCGVVESLQKVERTEKTKGIAGTKVTPGMAIGGVAGGLLGNQIGSGGGRGAATVLGAAGGAYAGHAIERHNHRYTAYVMHIRMDDGAM